MTISELIGIAMAANSGITFTIIANGAINVLYNNAKAMFCLIVWLMRLEKLIMEANSIVFKGLCVYNMSQIKTIFFYEAHSTINLATISFIVPGITESYLDQNPVVEDF